MTNPVSAPAPTLRAADALALLEAAARRELAYVAAALPPAPATADALLAHLAWDLGLAGSEVLGELPAQDGRAAG